MCSTRLDEVTNQAMVAIVDTGMSTPPIPSDANELRTTYVVGCRGDTAAEAPTKAALNIVGQLNRLFVQEETHSL